MRVRDVACTSCSTALPTDLLDGAFHMCPRCLNWNRVLLFPAFTRPDAAPVAEPVLIEGQSSCFYHPHKTAIVPCESCGRFLCSLCDVEIGGVHRCPKCLESGRRKQELQTLQTEHTRYDRIALALTTLALFFWPITLITAPAALYMVIRYWNKRSVVLPGGRIGYVVAGVIAIAEIVGWAFLFYFMIRMAEIDPKPTNQVRYQRVRGLWQIGTLSRASLFTGGDHLLVCDYRTGFTERYRRFYFSDIQAIIIRKTPNWLIGISIWGSFAIGFLVIALASRWNLFLKISEGICLFFVLRHLIRGPSCRTHIQTAVQTDLLPMLKRERKTNRVLSRIFPLIEQAQGGAITALPVASPPLARTFTSPSETSVSSAAPPPTITEEAPVPIPHSLSWLHVWLFVVVLLTGLNAIWEVNYPSAVSMGILLGLFSVSVFGGIVAMVRQAKHRVHTGAALMTWVLVITFVVGMGGVDYVFTLIEAFNQGRTNSGRSPTLDFLSPFELRHMAGFDGVLWTFGIWALLLGLLGLIFIFMRPPVRIQPPPLPGTSRA